MTALDDFLASAVARGAHVGGVAIAATRDDVIYEAGFGTMAAGGDPVVSDAPLRAASLTKALTTAAVLQLVERGELELDEPVASIIPAFGALPVLDGFDGDEPRLRPPASQATVRQLLNHTAGFGYGFFNEKLAKYHAVTGAPDALTFQRGILELPLVNDPGTRWEYGTSIDWAGQVVEAVSGQRLDAYLADQLFGPLAMGHTTFELDDEQFARLMPLHARLADGTLGPGHIEWPRVPEICSGGGGAYTTAGDYCRFMRAILRGGELDGERVLSEDSVMLMVTPSLGDLPLPGAVPSIDPELCNDIPAFPVPDSWGLGFHIVLADLPGMRRAGTADWAGLTNSYYWIDRASNVCGAILAQVLPFFDQQIVETAFGFEAAVYAGVAPTTPPR